MEDGCPDAGAGKGRGSAPVGRLVFKTSEGRASVSGGFDSRPLPPHGLEVVLVGGGHAHVEVLRRFAMAPPAGMRLALVARDTLTPYSGMLPGYLAGRYERGEAHIDLRPLAVRAGARLIHAAACGLDLERRQVLFAARPPLAFDLASLDIGSRPPVAAIAGARRHALAVKPVDAFLEGWRRVEAAASTAGRGLRVVVVGGGAGGVELCLSLAHRLGRALAAAGRAPPAFALVTEGDRLLEGHGARAGRLLAAALARAGIALHAGRRAASAEPGALVLDDGTAIACDAAVLATGAAAPSWLAHSGLALDGAGFVRVDACLRSVSHPFLLAAGDVASFDPRPLEKNGVQAVRQGPLLARNLRRLAAGRRPVAFRPRRRSLALIASGAGRAVASWGPLACEGAWTWRWKEGIDRRWMRRYRTLPAMAPEDGRDAMRCGGCGAKVPAHVLRRALARLRAARPETLAPMAALDDAAEIAPPPGTVAVQTADQFPAFIDDPYVFGRIAAVHALSDIHAMGAQAASALVLAGLLPGSAQAMEEELVQMLQGVVSILEREGCALAGGHSGEASGRPGLGLAVTGFAPPASLVRLGGLQAGDALLLTRPLGSGVLFAADMRGEAQSPWIEAALAGMQRSNGPPARILQGHGVHAMTDVTGFGLAGHLRAMLVASGTGARLDCAALPAWPGARRLLARGIASTLHPGNAAAAGDMLDAATADPLLFDPQTAGGLLAGLPAARAGDCLRALREAGCDEAAIVGEVTQGPPAIRLRGGGCVAEAARQGLPISRDSPRGSA